MAKIDTVRAVVVSVGITLVLAAIRARMRRTLISGKFLGNRTSPRVERLSVESQQLWWVLPIVDGIVVQQLICSDRLEVSTMVVGAIRHFSQTQRPVDPLNGVLVCCGLGRAHPFEVFGSVGTDDGWEYYSCPSCETSYRKEVTNAH